MTTAVRASTSDGWADATQMATQEVLDDHVVAARRKAWVRRALPMVAVGAVIVAANLAFDAAVGTEAAITPIWDLPFALSESGIGLAVVGLVLNIVSSARSSAAGLDLKLVGPADLLTRSERARVRQDISKGTSVRSDQRTVVVATARRMTDQGRAALLYVGQVCLVVGLTLGSPSPFTVVLMTSLAGWTVVAALRDQVLARRARRWLALNG